MSLANVISKDRGQPATVRIGIVTAINPLVVTVQSTPLTNVGSLEGSPLAVGDTVALLGQSAVSADGSSWLALGHVVPTSDVLGDPLMGGIQTFTASQNNGTAVYATMTGVNFQWRKLRTNSRVLMNMAGSAFCTVVNMGGEFGMQFVDNAGVIASVDHAVCSHFFNVITTHLGFAGMRILGSGVIPAGSYTINGRFREYVVAGLLAVDTNDRFSLTLAEID